MAGKSCALARYSACAVGTGLARAGRACMRGWDGVCAGGGVRGWGGACAVGRRAGVHGCGGACAVGAARARSGWCMRGWGGMCTVGTVRARLGRRVRGWGSAGAVGAARVGMRGLGVRECTVGGRAGACMGGVCGRARFWGVRHAGLGSGTSEVCGRVHGWGVRRCGGVCASGACERAVCTVRD
ncbi:hypothetical protein HWV62_4317, partial [Athelia sp. TMB]